MQSQSSKVKVYTISALILAAIGFAICLLCYLCASDSSDYFIKSHPLPMLASALSIAAVLWFVSAFILIPKDTLPTHDFTQRKICIPAILPIVGVLASGMLAAGYIAPSELSKILHRQRPIDTTVICASLVLIGALLSIAYYLLRLINEPKLASASVVLGIGPVALLSGLCGLTYFELDHHMNAPAKVVLQLAFIATMLFLTSELRLTLDRAQPRRYLVFASIALFANLCATAGALPALLNPEKAMHSTRILGFALLCLCNAVYIGCRLVQFSQYCNIAQPDNSSPEQTQGKDDQDGCQQQDSMAS